MLHDLAIRLLRHRRLFHPAPADRDAFEPRLRRSPAALTYGILFTPRSGSSRLTDIARTWESLGQPDECFNPGFVPGMSRKLDAGTLAEYVEMLRRRNSARQTWGFEATPEHVRQVFLTDSRFLRLTAPDRLIGLIRHDIVAQAISIDKNVQTRLGHSNRTTPEAVAAADELVVYRPRRIAHYVRRLADMERRIEALLHRFDGPALRLSYEATVQLTPHELRILLAAFLGTRQGPMVRDAWPHTKIGTALNQTHADRFRAERGDWLARLEARRAAYLPSYPASVDVDAAIA